LTEGRCPTCRARVASDQRYCLNCGTRLVRLGPPVALTLKQPSAEPPQRMVNMPGPKLSALLTAAALGLGLFVGGAINPGSSVTNIAAGAPALAGSSQANAAPTPLGPPTLGAAVGNTAAANPPAGPAASAAVPAPVPAPTTVAPTPVASVPASEPANPTHAGGHSGSGNGSAATGVVLHVNPAARSYSLASGGQLLPIHSGKLPLAGTKVSVPIEPLTNGTFAEAGKRRKTGRATDARFAGTVTFVDPSATAYTVSAHGASVLVRLPPIKTGAIQPPQLGALVTITVKIAKIKPARLGRETAQSSVAAVPADSTTTPPTDPSTGSNDPAAGSDPTTGSADPTTGTPDPTLPQAPPPPCPPPLTPIVPATAPAANLWQTTVHVTGQATGPVDLEGIVQAACPVPRQLLLSADDVRQGAADLTLGIGDGIDATKLLPGQPVDVTATLGADGSYLITGLIGDQGKKGADDPSSGQGDQAQ
jgi:hypothetical protein